MPTHKLPTATWWLSSLCVRCRLRAQRVTATNVVPTAQLSGRFTPATTVAFQQPQRFLSSTRQLWSASQSTPSPSPETSPPPTRPRIHYDFFPESLPDGPPPAGHFPIDVRALRREFLKLQARAHPDMHPPETKAAAEGTSALINEAYRTLANPLLRAQYLLSLRGVDVATDETLKIEEPALLMDVLEAREDIEAAESEADLQETRAINDERIATSEAELERAFRNDDVEAAKREAVRLRYWVNIKESLDNWERGKPIVLEH
ncbi:hypothetical protein S7711_00882 [Stachybotrys chartarum IBT 7711]|uniref:J domain-containing protein n=1 Tax=Stachybotrys chartarum (strain CBS 109288 / IBT 7711) TaxID=1280523 RepID=A0A084B0H9_STACB|nr:hypothetical protein S7711_00882 [Stachybotrys chartarum IBT 7711]